MINFDQFQQAWNAFENDLSLVGHPQDPKVSIFAPPREWGKYNLTLLPKDLNESQVKENLTKVKIIGVTCMDKRVTYEFYQFLAKGHSPTKVLLISVGGGIVQSGQERKQAMKTILTYLSEKTANLNEVVISDHDCRCGAVAFWLKAKPEKLPKGFGDKPGCVCEKEIMKSLIAEGYRSLVPQEWKEEGRIKACLVTPKEKEKTVYCQPFDPQLVKPKSIEDFKKNE